MRKQTPFYLSESGAVTVDWVVLTAGLVGLGLATMSVVSTGVQDTSGDINAALVADGIISASFASDHVQVDDIPYEGGVWGGIMAQLDADLGTAGMQSLNQSARAAPPQAIWEALADYGTQYDNDPARYDMYIYIAQVQGVPLDCLDSDTCGQGTFPGVN